MPSLLQCLAPLPANRAGLRLCGLRGLPELLAQGSVVGSIAESIIGAHCRPVRAILFDKSPLANWALGWHQDRTIAVRRRIDAPGFGPWTMKAGMRHVEPPFALLAGMITLRIHLDPVPAENALVALGTHGLGRIEEAEIGTVVAKHRIHSCLAASGDVWCYRTPILHASATSTNAGRRRVLQVDYSSATLPHGLEWLGV